MSTQPHCPECKKEVSSPEIKTIQSKSPELIVPTVLAYCPNCGCIFGVSSQEMYLPE